MRAETKEVPSPLFRGIPKLDLEELLAAGTNHRLGRHEALYRAGEELTGLFVVRTGSLKLVRHSPEGKEVIVSLVGAGEPCGPFAEPCEATETAQALEATECSLLPLSALRRAMSRNPGLGINLLAYAQKRLSEATAVTARLTFQSVPERIAQLLSTETDPLTGMLSFPLTQSEIANLIGSSRETVCSTLNQFRRQGLIRIDRGQLRVLDRPGLLSTR